MNYDLTTTADSFLWAKARKKKRKAAPAAPKAAKAAEKKQQRRKAAPPPSRPSKPPKPRKPARARKPRGQGWDARAERAIGNWLGYFSDSVQDGKDLSRLILLGVGLMVLLYYGFNAGGYFAIQRSWGELVILYLIVQGLIFRLQTPARLPLLGKIQVGVISGLALWVLVSISWSIIPARSFDEFIRAILYLAGFALVYIYLSRREWLTWIGHMFLVIAGIVAFASLWQKVFAIGSFDFDARLSWPLTYWNTMGMTMVMAFPLALRVVTDRATNIVLRCFYSALMLLYFVVLFFTLSRASLGFFILALAIYVFFSINRLRALLQSAIVLAWGGLVIFLCSKFFPAMMALQPAEADRAPQGHGLGLLVMVAFLGVIGSQLGLWALEKRISFSPQRIRQIGYGVAVASAVAVVLAGGLVLVKQGGPAAMVSKVTDSFSDNTKEQASTSAGDRLLNLNTQRPQEYKVSIDNFAAHPLTGTGSATWSAVWLQRRPAFIDPTNGSTYGMPVKNGHSMFFEALAELGIIGGLLVVGFIVIFIWHGIRDLRMLGRSRHREIYGAFFAGCVALILHAQMDWDWQMSFIFLAFFMFAGGLMRYGVISRQAVAAGGEGSAAVAEKPAERALPRFLAWPWLVGAGCVIMMIVTIFPMVSAWKLNAARTANNAAVSALNQKNSAAAQANFLVVQQDARWAGRFDPLEGDVYMLQGQAALGLGNNDEGEQLMRQAIDREPNNYSYYNNLSRVLINENRIDEAAVLLRKSRGLNPLDSHDTSELEEAVKARGGPL